AILASAFSEPGVIWAIVLIAFGVFLFRQEDPPEPPDRRPPPPGGGAGPAGHAPGPAPAGPPGTTTTARGAPPPPPPRPRGPPFVGRLTFAAALIVTGLVVALNNLDVLDLSVGQV